MSPSLFLTSGSGWHQEEAASSPKEQSFLPFPVYMFQSLAAVRAQLEATNREETDLTKKEFMKLLEDYLLSLIPSLPVTALRKDIKRLVEAHSSFEKRFPSSSTNPKICLP